MLKRWEAYWIFKLQTLAPKGLSDELLLNVMVLVIVLVFFQKEAGCVEFLINQIYGLLS